MKNKTHESITIRVTLAEAAQLRSMGRADIVALRMVRNALVAPISLENATTGNTTLEVSLSVPESLPAPPNKPTQVNASTNDMSSSGLSGDFIFWLANNCHDKFAGRLYKLLETYGRGETCR